MKFPILTFSRPSIIEIINSYDELTSCTAKALRNGYYSDLIIIDNDSIQYRIKSAKKIETVRPFWGFNILFSQRIKVELIFLDESKITIEEVRLKIFDSFENWHGWSTRDDFDQLKLKIRNAESITEIIKWLGD